MTKKEKKKDEFEGYTMKMCMHLNGGSEFSFLTYEVRKHGKLTNITRTTKTNGSPKYKKISDTFDYGEDSFDFLTNGTKGLQEWLDQHTRELDNANG